MIGTIQIKGSWYRRNSARIAGGAHMVNAIVWLLSLISSDIVHLSVLCEIVGLSLYSDEVRDAVVAHGVVKGTEGE